MGSYSSVCAISQLPIDYGHEIVAIKLVKNRFDSCNTKYVYVPDAWPVFGKYNSSGEIEDEDRKVVADMNECAFIHRKVWDNSSKFYHKENRKTPNGWFNSIVPVVLEEAKREIASEYRSDKHWDLNDCITLCLSRELSNAYKNGDYSIILRDVFFNSPQNLYPDIKGLPDNHPDRFNLLRNRGNFEQAVIERMNNWDNKYEKILTKIVHLWSGIMVTGHQIFPSNSVYIEQCPRYGQRINMLRFYIDLAKHLK